MSQTAVSRLGGAASEVVSTHWSIGLALSPNARQAIVWTEHLGDIRGGEVFLKADPKPGRLPEYPEFELLPGNLGVFDTIQQRAFNHRLSGTISQRLALRILPSGAVDLLVGRGPLNEVSTGPDKFEKFAKSYFLDSRGSTTKKLGAELTAGEFAVVHHHFGADEAFNRRTIAGFGNYDEFSLQVAFEPGRQRAYFVKQMLQDEVVLGKYMYADRERELKFGDIFSVVVPDKGAVAVFKRTGNGQVDKYDADTPGRLFALVADKSGELAAYSMTSQQDGYDPKVGLLVNPSTECFVEAVAFKRYGVASIQALRDDANRGARAEVCSYELEKADEIAKSKLVLLAPTAILPFLGNGIEAARVSCVIQADWLLAKGVISGPSPLGKILQKNIFS